MATIQNTKSSTGNTRSVVVAWTGLTSGDDGDPVQFSQYTDKSVQVSGSFGAGGSVRLEGSNNGIDYAPLTDPQGNDINITSPKIKMASEATLYVRPRVTAGDGSTSLNVHLLIKE
jgi:hypothetical protein